jgi:Arc/MetJ-type ribon-helix-helix transcriptional regulator
MSDLIALRLPPDLLAEIRETAAARNYLSIQEYLRDAVRRDLERYHQAKAELDAIITSAKKVTPRHMTRAERDKLARTYSKELAQYEKETLGTLKPVDGFAQHEHFLAWRKSKGLRD